MSTVKVTNIQHPSASAPAITLDSAGAMTGSFPYPNRNLLYNGAMQVAQRGTSTASITTPGYYTADRWVAYPVTSGTWTQSIENDAPTGSGLRKSLKMLCTTAKASLGSGDELTVVQRLEGQDLQRIAKGTASAQQLALSFWVKSNVTGTYTILLYDVDNVRGVSASYTISASATWEKKTITFPADTTGVLDNDNSQSLELYFQLAMGSSYTSGTLQTTWGTYTAANRAVGQTNLAAATNNYWQITGTQLEIGPVATSFEFEPYETTLRKCQRYYQRFSGGSAYSSYGQGPAFGTTGVFPLVRLTQTMRVKPTAIEASNITVSDTVGNPLSSSAFAIDSNYSGPDAVSINVTVTGATQYRTYFLLNNNNTAGYLGVSAEL